MVEFNIKRYGEGHYYFPKELRKVITDRAIIVPNFCAAIIHPENANLKDVIGSVRRLLEEFEARARGKEDQS